MKKRVNFFIVALLVLILAGTLMACDETGKIKTPTHLSFVNPYITSSSFSPVFLTGEGMQAQEDDFNFSKVKLQVEYSDGTKGDAITLTESMLAPDNTGDYRTGNGWQTFTVQYTVNNVTVKGTFRVYTRLRTEADFATMTFVTNGGSPNDFTKKVTKGSIYTTYSSFTSVFTQVTKANHTLLGWVILPQDFDFSKKTAAEINAKANALAAVNIYSPTAWPTDIEITRNVAFCAVWQENTTQVTFDYNFARFNIAQNLWQSFRSTATDTSMFAPNAALPRPNIPDNAIAGWKFTGWFSDSDLTLVRSFNQQVGGTDFTLYAKWERVYYSITFNLVGGTLNDKYYIVEEDGDLFEKVNPTDLAHPTLLKGEVIRYDSTGAISSVAYTDLDYGVKLNGTQSHYLTRTMTTVENNHYIFKGLYAEGYYYTFRGWYEDREYTKPKTLNDTYTVENKNIVLYAKWEINTNLADQYYEGYLFKDKYIVKADGTIKLTGVNDVNIAEIRLPNRLDGKDITEIADDTFYGCNLLSKFSINETSLLTKIGARAFRFCSKLDTISVIRTNGDVEDIAATTANLKIVSVGKDAFRGTTWLSAHPSTWITIGKVLVKFNGLESTKKIIPISEKTPEDNELGTALITYGNELNKVDRISADAFVGLSRLTHITIPNSIQTIENDAFAECSNLAIIKVQEKLGGGYNLKDVGGTSFSQTAWFKYPSIEDNNFAQYGALILGNIYYRFAGSKAITTTMVTIPSGISLIASDAFQDYGNIRSITFLDKASIKKIGVNAFNDTAWYTLTANANNGFVIVNGIVLGYIGRGQNVTSSDGQTTLKAVYIPEKDADGKNVTTIATNAFYGYYVDSIDAISMPETITEIQPYSFRGATRLKTLTYLGTAKEHIFDGLTVSNSLPVIYENSFDGAVSGVLVSSQMTLFISDETHTSGSSLYKTATTNIDQIYYKIYTAKNTFLSRLENNGIRVKANTLPQRYVASPGWSIRAEWEQTSALDPENKNCAVLVIMRSDGLPYETPLLLEYINSETINSALTTTVPHSLTINYNAFSCQFDYHVEPKIQSITIDNGASENSQMSRAQYYETSKRFVYAGGKITINYLDAGVASRTIALIDCVGSSVAIKGFTVSSIGTKTLKFTYSTQLQSVECNYQYTVNKIENVDIDFNEPLQVDIDSVVDLGNIILKIIRNDIADGGQIFDEGGSGYAYDNVFMDNGKVKIVKVDGVEAAKFNTSSYGIHTITVKYGSDTLGWTSEIDMEYEVVLSTAQSWYLFNALTTTTELSHLVNGVDVYKGTAAITGIKTGHLATIVIPRYIDTIISGVNYRLDVVEIADSAFSGNNILVNVYLSPSLNKIGNSAFLNCLKLALVAFSEGEVQLADIGSRAFEGCAALKSVTMPQSLSTIGNSAFKNTGLEAIDLSQTQIIEISDSAFAESLLLASVTLPSVLEEIGNNAFKGCVSLASISLGNSITYIGTYAFYHCNDNLSVTIGATVPPSLQAMAFGTETSTYRIEVPAASVNAYKAATGWTVYSNIIFGI